MRTGRNGDGTVQVAQDFRFVDVARLNEKLAAENPIGQRNIASVDQAEFELADN